MSLKSGDIILYPVTQKSNLLDKVIGLVEKLTGPSTKYQYGHCAIYLKRGIQIEAFFPFCRVSHIKAKRPKQLFRYKGITNKQREQVIKNALDKVGQWYDVLQVLSFNMVILKHQNVCSTLVNEAYKAAGIVLSNKKNTSPDDLASNKKLKRIK
jgi:uncharacterized protein YycO